MPEVTADYIRLPVMDGHTGPSHRIRTITISTEQGIKALYCGTHKTIITYLFRRDKGWTMDKADEWLKEHKGKSATEIIKGAFAEALAWLKDIATGLPEPDEPEPQAPTQPHTPVAVKPQVRVLNELPHALMEPPLWIQVLPGPGKWNHPAYGEIDLPLERLERFVSNFKNKVYQDRIPLDAEHETKLSGATGYYEDLELRGEGGKDGVWARPSWTDRGVSLLKSDRFRYFSPEWYDEWEDPATGAMHKDVLIGGALTTRPFFKEGSLAPLAAGEVRLFETDEDGPPLTLVAVPAEAEPISAAEWDSAYQSALPDSCFAYIEPGGEKDEDGKTVPRSKRHFPIKDKNGEYDAAHVRNALARAPQSPFGSKAMPKIRAAAKALGIGEPAEEAEKQTEDTMPDNDKPAIGMTEDQAKRFADLEKQMAEMTAAFQVNETEKKQLADSLKATEAQLAAEKEARLAREFAERAAQYKHTAAEPDKLASLLRWAYGADPAKGEELEAILKANDAALEKSELFKEFGSNRNAAPVSAEAEIEKRIRQKMSEASLDYAKAMKAVQEADPELFMRRAKELGERDRKLGTPEQKAPIVG